jgi:hypothetical protein
MQWHVGDGEIRAAASYDLGYGEDNSIAVEHQREIVFVQEHFWLLFDRVCGEGTHRIESRFQFAPGALRLDGNRVHTGHEDANLLLWPISTAPYTDVGIEEGEENPRSGWYSPRYGLLESVPCLSLKVEQSLPFFAVTLLYPFRGTALPDVSLSLEGASVNVRTSATNTVRIDSRLT